MYPKRRREKNLAPHTRKRRTPFVLPARMLPHSIFHDRTRPKSKVGSVEVKLRKMGVRPDSRPRNEQRDGAGHGYRPRPGEAGVAAVSMDLYERVTQYHAQIGSHIGQETLRTLEQSLLREANSLLRAQHWESALNTFTHALAVCEKAHAAGLRLESQTLEAWAKAKLISEKKQVQGQASILQNIGYCLHCLGELEAAKEYYTQAARALVQARKANAFIDWWRYGDETEVKLQTIKSRLDDISEGNRPYDHANEDRELPYWRGSGSARGGCEPGAGQALESAPALARHEYEVDGAPASPDVQYAVNSAAADEEDGSPQDPDAEEEARKEWLQYHLQREEWDLAGELIATAEEQEDLEYLMGRAEREHTGDL